ncbi:PAS domain S-box protein [Agrobacterium rubi]|uniref:sensor histidine kinase n=1 Tax=Agrobacterium rubi TaxID=28099 RepID=UPI001572A894|nr:PAS domain S-box protein [Agrobacterium rubi]NTF10688.1 PAS domain S-box protein [Agrobacterium rubi]NTF23082.1 PAS domain S-box protein [Agrobacterium rubi]NTF30013.1 PAS domain S-box protein [Agrobacterium rubi]
MPSTRIADLVLESAVDYAIITFDLNGLVTSWSKGAETIMGWREEEMIGNPAEAFFTPEDRWNKIPQMEMGNALTQGRGLDERWHLRKDGKRFFALGEMLPLKDEGGPVEGFLKILRDRTAQKLAQDALIEAQQELSRAQEVGGVGTFSVDIDSGDLKGSKEFFRLFGVSQGHHTAKDLEQIIHPDDRYLATNDQMRLHGDGEGNAEYRILRPGTKTVRWIARRAEYERGTDGKPVRLIGTVQDITERKTNQELQATLNHELSHRLKNQLAMVQSIVTQSFRNTTDLKAIRDTIVQRLGVLAQAHNLVVAGLTQKTDIRSVVEETVRLHEGQDVRRFEISGPVIEIGPRPALSLALMVHELATNAVKYGALSAHGGRVVVGWQILEDGNLEFAWSECDGPTVVFSDRKGFGSRLIKGGIAGTRSEVDVAYDATGLRCRMIVPISDMSDEN